MAADFFKTHQATLDHALSSILERNFWSAYPENPSPRAYGETAAQDGQAAFEAYRGKAFPLTLEGAQGEVGNEQSPFGFDLGIRYPKVPVDQLLAQSQLALDSWRDAGPQAWVGICLEILHRLNQRSFEIAHAVQHTTGQGFMMAFQAGGPHAQERALEAVAYAWQEMSRIPGLVDWIKPQGKHDPIQMKKQFKVVPRGVGLVIGCSTFPTWNGYPGLFASLATGNTVIVKPHPGAILPLAITVAVARDVLAEAGFNPNVVLLAAHEPQEDTAQQLAMNKAVKLIDFTGSSQNGNWLEENARHALVYTEKAGVNQVIIDSVDDFKAVARNLAFSFALYSGQMCTAPQNIYVPRDGIRTADGVMSFDEVAQGLAQAVQKLVSDPARAVEITGAVQNEACAQRIDQARQLGMPILADSQTLEHPAFPGARVRTPLVLQARVDQPEIQQEWFGPIVFVVQTDSTEQSIEVAGRNVIEHGALTLSAYSTDDAVTAKIQRMAERSGVSLSLNLTGAVFINQTAAYSDFHGTGANPAANASLSDSAYVANRFRVVQTRWHF
ncbi:MULTISPECIES: phenylacetic acid degradation protein PaaN [Alcaligenes]|jgi:phenylacetic acid degradation protein paaN|uniref:Phenylacetic acid degradation protein PaaN n=1 Tax=Alcaligenes faecalis TaxID=511 RepID=A0AB33CUY4_ALCFA|nr:MULTISPECIES: phenylacetic acid degradation protein PaaN [Alcaligenes]ASR90086.1 phenylacetic acid degradation protein PaaN [Alcaligenes faecalis]AWG34899.1 phenylacetic acid degradation protein PaaN [Alcaligenes aquatilis]MCC9162170.1 phenylacetic acid degradation protein PaaN [Alcaligenes sp. MMA]MCH4224170.1 phenylacetic acid degradation protein PaaN [Alcaligenes faecalis]UYY85966.1 phenylacetic acid degradation protein PaaN [Alcaligenes sp. SMD-FA]